MRQNYKQIKEEFTSICSVLKQIACKLEEQITEILENTPHIDRIICRVKTVESFMNKTEKLKDDGTLKYAVPMKEIQDMIGARVVVYYKTDVQVVKEIMSNFYQAVEKTTIVQDDPAKFGYEGFHMVCFVPNTIFSSRGNPLVNNFFELQVKTLYQHAWSQSNHGLGYKPDSVLSNDDQRMLAFVAAQSWGADRALSEIVLGQK